jgi:uncharacterized membrane protein YkvA (DUF1232 family)
MTDPKTVLAAVLSEEAAQQALDALAASAYQVVPVDVVPSAVHVVRYPGFDHLMVFAYRPNAVAFTQRHAVDSVINEEPVCDVARDGTVQHPPT